MKNLIALLFLSNLIYASTPSEVLMPINNVYSPKGFDSNDRAEIIVTGYLPNLCHKSPKTKFKVYGKNIMVTVTSLKYSDSDPFCAEVAVPFLETIDLGILEKGEYKVIVNEGSEHRVKGELIIAEVASGRIDQFTYPAVEHVEKDYSTRTIKLKGYNPSDCFTLDHIKVVSNDEDTYSVLPILKRVTDFCPMKMTEFSYEVEVPDEINSDVVLLHVRSMNGSSLNTLFDNRLR